MKKYRITEKLEVEEIVCDVCGFSSDQEIEIDEFLCIAFVGGYNSVFGDMSRVECDICQQCLKEMIGKYARVADWSA